MSDFDPSSFNPDAKTPCGINTQYWERVIYPLLLANGIGVDQINDNIGEKSDLVPVPYDDGISSVLAFLQTGYYHIHGISFVYPDHADAVTLTSGAGAWNLTGALVEVIPAGALSISAFDLHWANIGAIGDNSEVQVDIFSGGVGSEVRIGATRSQRNTNQSRENANKIQIPQQVVGTRISCRLSDSTGGTTTINISFEGHFYTI